MPRRYLLTPLLLMAFLVGGTGLGAVVHLDHEHEHGGHDSGHCQLCYVLTTIITGALVAVVAIVFFERLETRRPPILLGLPLVQPSLTSASPRAPPSF